MPLLQSLIRRLSKRWYGRMATEKLIARLPQLRGAAAQAALDALQERMAHQDGSLTAVDWSRARLDGALLAAWRLDSARFADARLRGAYFAYAQLQNADFSGADLREAHFREAQLRGATLRGADLREVNFARADLRRADLRDADLRGVNWWRANLQDARLDPGQASDLSQLGIIKDPSDEYNQPQQQAEG